MHFEIRQSDETRINPYPYLFEGKSIVISNNKEEFLEDNSTLTSSESNEVTLGETKDTKTEIPLDQDTIDIKTINSNNDNLNKKIEYNNPDDNSIFYLNNHEYSAGSIVDGLKSIGADSSFDYRTLLAYENGIHNYRGSYEQNIKLLNLFKDGKLKKV
ncbi:MAG: DUF3597 domain-containing protein [Bacilli bacterium]|nr:DUF3597 domain-containing protein [Bacilli bacterium]